MRWAIIVFGFMQQNEFKLCCFRNVHFYAYHLLQCFCFISLHISPFVIVSRTQQQQQCTHKFISFMLRFLELSIFFCIVSFPNWSSVNPWSANSFSVCATLYRLEKEAKKNFWLFLGNTCSKTDSWELPKQVLDVHQFIFANPIISFVYHLKPYDFNKTSSPTATIISTPPDRIIRPPIFTSPSLKYIQFKLLSQSTIHWNRQKIMTELYPCFGL